MKKILIGIMAVALCLGLVGGAFAAFSDTEESSGNTFTAGTLDLELTGTPSLPVSLTNMKPGDSTSMTLDMKNVGSLDGDLSWVLTYSEADGTPTSEFACDMTADEFAKLLVITSPVNYTPAGGSTTNVYSAWLSYAGNNDGDGSNLSIYDVAAAGTWNMTETLTAGGTATIALTMELPSGTGNNAQADGIAVTITATLVQH